MRPCSVVHPMRVVVGKILCPALRADSRVRCAAPVVAPLIPCSLRAAYFLAAAPPAWGAVFGCPCRPCPPLPAALPPRPAAGSLAGVLVLGFWFSWGCLCLVLCLWWVLVGLPVSWLARCPVVGCGRVGRCLVVPVGILRRLVCLCRSALLRWLLFLRGRFRCSAGGFGCVLVPLVRRFFRLAACRFRWRLLSLPCLVGGRCRLFARCCLPCLRFLRWRCWVFSLPGWVAVAGSRVLPASGSALVARVVSDLAAGGASLVVGCCTGADAAVLSLVPGSVPPSLVRCCCAFGAGAGGAGSCSLSALSAVSAFASAGGPVSWWSGGGAGVALPARLSARTRAVVCAASAGLVVFFASPVSRGSLLACRYAVASGLPVVAFPCGFSGSALPLLGVGSWVSVGGDGFGWVSGQAVLF